MNFKHIVDLANITQRTARQFTVPNPKYYIALQQQKSTRFTSEFEALNTKRFFPFGALYLDGYNTPLSCLKSDTSISLRPLQIPVFELLKHEKGALLYAKTGAGKTVLTIALHDIWGGNMLVIAHNIGNVKYFHDEFKTFLGVNTGMMCTGNNTIGKVTITTFNTFKKKRKIFENFIHPDGTIGFDNLMIDEADAFFTEKSREAVNLFPAIRKHAFTGTKKTAYDEYSKNPKGALEMFYGKLIVAENDDSKDPLEDVFFQKYENEYYEEIEGERVYIPSFQWHKFREFLDEDIPRKKKQWEYIMNNTNPVEHTLILFDRIIDVESFYKKAQDLGIKSFMNHGSLKKKYREETLENFYNEGGYCFAQYKTMGRGYDNDRLTKCFILFPAKGENSIRQIVGRVVRWLDGKKSYVYTWYDSALKSQQYARTKVFKEHFNIKSKEI